MRLHVVLQPSLRKWTCPKMDMPENGRAPETLPKNAAEAPHRGELRAAAKAVGEPQACCQVDRRGDRS